MAAAPDMPQPIKLRIEDFLLLNESGAFDDYAKSELIEGEIVITNSQFQRHSYAKTELIFRLMSILRSSTTPFIVLSEASVAMPPLSMPEPDIVIMTGPVSDGPVSLSSAALLIEVADTTLAIDLGRKAALYAREAVPEYWVVDLVNRQIVQHSQPGESGYAMLTNIPFGTQITAATIADLTVDTAGLR